jgi:hypothetical protein
MSGQVTLPASPQSPRHAEADRGGQTDRQAGRGGYANVAIMFLIIIFMNISYFLAVRADTLIGLDCHSNGQRILGTFNIPFGSVAL